MPPFCQNIRFDANTIEKSQSRKQTQQTSVVSDDSVTQPESITIDNVYVEEADTYLAEANMWGQALSQHRDWRQRKQLASLVICLPLRPASSILGPLYWHK